MKLSNINKTHFPTVEIIILHRNGEKLIDNCLKTVEKTDYPNFKSTILLNGCKDNSKELIKKKYPYVKILESKKSLGFAEGNNLILNKSKAKYSLLLNNDTEVDKNWLKEMVKVAEENKDIATVQPKVKSLKNKQMLEYAGAAGGFIDVYGYPFCRGRIYDKIELDKGQYNDKIQLFWGCGVALLINNSILKKIGSLDNDFFAYAEELDFCWRANIAGYKNMFAPNAVIYHLGSADWSNPQFKFKKNYLLFRNHFMALLKNYSLASIIKALPVKIILEFITFLGFLIKDPIIAAASLKADIFLLTHIPSIIKKNKKIQKLRKISDKELRKLMLKDSIATNRFLFGENNSFEDYKDRIRSLN